MGHAISRTKPSIVAFDLFAREPSIDVFCGGLGPAVNDATAQPANKQKRKIRFIRPPYYQGSHQQQPHDNEYIDKGHSLVLSQ
jgi:hypothetical protein